MPPVILATNLFSLGGTISASTTEAGYYAASLADGLEYTHWKANAGGAQSVTLDLGVGNAQAADALGVKKHNLKTVGATVSVESSDDGAVWTPRLAGFVPSTDKALLKTFASATARYWRIGLAGCTAAPQMAVAVVGPRIDFPYPPNSPFVPSEEGIEGETNRSKLGVLLGVTVRWKTFRVRATWTRLLRTWLDANLAPFWDGHASNLKPFFWGWDLSAYPDKVHYGAVPDGYKWRPDVSRGLHYETFEIEIEGAKE
jgi:hypothetical protein